MTIYENEAGLLSHDTAQGFLRIDWLSGPREDEHIKEVFEQTLVHCQLLQCNKLLVNQGSMSSASMTVENWFLYEWLPRAVQTFAQGYCAIVAGRFLFTHLDSIALLREVEYLSADHQQLARYPIRMLESEPMATHWLKQCSEQPLEELRHYFQ